MQDEINKDNNGNVEIGDNDVSADLERHQSTPLNKNQKIAVAVLAVFGILVIVFWAVQFKTTLKNSLKHTSNSDTESSNSSEDIVANEDNKSNEALKTKDTDGDGLSDWDELNTYKTSPYLDDSDSDGYSDKKEIDSDNDPNCPQGTTCNEVETDINDQTSQNNSSTVSDTSIDSLSQDQINLLNKVGTSSVGNFKDESEAQNLLKGALDVKSLRDVLIQNGFDQNTLNNISDEELKKIYNDTLQNFSQE